MRLSALLIGIAFCAIGSTQIFSSSVNLGRVMPVGDSLTKGWDEQGLGGYRGRLWTKLQARRVQFTVVGSQSGDSWNLPSNWVWHEGHNGWKTEDITANVSTWIVQQNPDTLLVRIGTNNTLDWNQPVLTNQKYLDLLNVIFTTKPTLKVYLANIPECNITTTWYESHHIHVGNVDNAVTNAVTTYKALGFNVKKVNTNTLDPSIDFRDSVHPNVGGFEKDSVNWYNVIISARN